MRAAFACVVCMSCSSPAEGFGGVGHIFDGLAGRCNYGAAYVLTLEPVDPACPGAAPLEVHDDGREVGACEWSINGQPGRVVCDDSAGVVERCEGETLREGCWYAVEYRRTGAP